MARKGYTSIYEPEFDRIKGLQHAGVSPMLAVRVTGRSRGTVDRIYESEHFADYKARLREFQNQYGKQPTTAVEPPVEEAPVISTPLVEAVEDQAPDLPSLA